MIHLCNSDAFVGALPPPESVGLNALFRGKIVVQDDVIAKCYIKPLPNLLRTESGYVPNMEIISEALGYTLAKNAQFKVPEYAGVIELAAQALPPNVLDCLKKQTPGVAPQESYYAWFCEDLTYPSLLKKEILGAPKELQQRRLTSLLQRLASHPDTPSVVTFDEWTENSDRNLGNLIELQGGKLALIDHGRIFRFPNWQAETLAKNSAHHCPNKLSNAIDYVESSWSEKTRTRSARIMAYNSLANYWKNGGIDAATDTLKIFLNDDQNAAVITYLEQALEPAKYSSRVGLLA